MKYTELLTVAEVMKLAGVSRSKLHLDTISGKIKSIKFGRNVRYEKAAAEKYAAEIDKVLNRR